MNALPTANSGVLATDGSGVPSISTTPTVTSITFGTGNALNTYVEGTWTPALNFGAATTGITYGSQAGNYTRIGRAVFVQYSITLTSKGSATGNATLEGLPYTSLNSANSGNHSVIGNWTSITLDAGFTIITGQINANSTHLTINENGSNKTNTTLTNTNFANTSVLSGSCFYFV